MKRILTTLALAATVLTTMAQAVERIPIQYIYACDSTELEVLYKKWDDYVAQHPHDEVGWRNFYHIYQFRNNLDISRWPPFEHKDEIRSHYNFVRRMKQSIPDTYTYYYIMLSNHWGATNLGLSLSENISYPNEHYFPRIYECACRAYELMPEDVGPQEMEALIREFYQYGDTIRLKKILTDYYKRGLCPSYVLQYHFNELQGMPDSALYIGHGDGNIIPKLVIQKVMGLHCDKILYDLNYCVNIVYNDRIIQQLGIDKPDYDQLRKKLGSWTDNIISFFCEQTLRSVCFSANTMDAQFYSEELKAHLYNEGLTMRYSATPYDNFAVKRRNIESLYLFDYLLYPFEPERYDERTWSLPSSFLALNYVILLQDQIPWYKQYDRKGYDRLAHIIRRILKQHAITDAAEEDIPPTIKIPLDIFGIVDEEIKTKLTPEKK